MLIYQGVRIFLRIRFFVSKSDWVYFRFQIPKMPMYAPDDDRRDKPGDERREKYATPQNNLAVKSDLTAEEQEIIEEENKERAADTTCLIAAKGDDIELLVLRIEYLEGPDYENDIEEELEEALCWSNAHGKDKMSEVLVEGLMNISYEYDFSAPAASAAWGGDSAFFDICNFEFMYEDAVVTLMNHPKIAWKKDLKRLDRAFSILKDNGVVFAGQGKNDFAPLAWCCQIEDQDCAWLIEKMIVQYGAELNIVDFDGKTPLMLACVHGHVQIVKCLLQHKAQINKAAPLRMTALMFACIHGDVDIVSYLIQQRANIEARSRGGLTPLMYACEHGHDHVVELLINHKVQVDAQNPNGMTAVMYAAQHGHHDAVKLLIDEGRVDVHKITIVTKNNALMLSSPGIDAKTALLLLDHKGKVNHINSAGDNALVHFLHKIASTKGEFFHPHLMKRIVRQTIDINLQNKHGTTALMFACRQPDPTVISRLLYAGANLNMCDIHNITPSLVVILEPNGKQQLEKVTKLDILIHHGLRPDVEMQAAIVNGSLAVLQLLIKYQLVVPVEVRLDRRMWFNAQMIVHPMKELFLTKGHALSPLMIAFMFNQNRAAIVMIEACFMLMSDLYPKPSTRVMLQGAFTSERGLRVPSLPPFFKSVYSQPWSLKTLCLVQVSNAIGFDGNREEKILQTGLDDDLQSKLEFERTLDNSEVIKWWNHQMRFSLGVKEKKFSAFNMAKSKRKQANTPKATPTVIAQDSPLSCNQRLIADTDNVLLADHGAGVAVSTDGVAGSIDGVVVAEGTDELEMD